MDCCYDVVVYTTFAFTLQLPFGWLHFGLVGLHALPLLPVALRLRFFWLPFNVTRLFGYTRFAVVTFYVRYIYLTGLRCCPLVDSGCCWLDLLRYVVTVHALRMPLRTFSRLVVAHLRFPLPHTRLRSRLVTVAGLHTHGLPLVILRLFPDFVVAGYVAVRYLYAYVVLPLRLLPFPITRLPLHAFAWLRFTTVDCTCRLQLVITRYVLRVHLPFAVVYTHVTRCCATTVVCGSFPFPLRLVARLPTRWLRLHICGFAVCRCTVPRCWRCCLIVYGLPGCCLLHIALHGYYVAGVVGLRCAFTTACHCVTFAVLATTLHHTFAFWLPFAVAVTAPPHV